MGLPPLSEGEPPRRLFTLDPWVPADSIGIWLEDGEGLAKVAPGQVTESDQKAARELLWRPLGPLRRPGSDLIARAVVRARDKISWFRDPALNAALSEYDSRFKRCVNGGRSAKEADAFLRWEDFFEVLQGKLFFGGCLPLTKEEWKLRLWFPVIETGHDEEQKGSSADPEQAGPVKGHTSSGRGAAADSGGKSRTGSTRSASRVVDFQLGDQPGVTEAAGPLRKGEEGVLAEVRGNNPNFAKVLQRCFSTLKQIEDWEVMLFTSHPDAVPVVEMPEQVKAPIAKYLENARVAVLAFAWPLDLMVAAGRDPRKVIRFGRSDGRQMRIRPHQVVPGDTLVDRFRNFFVKLDQGLTGKFGHSRNQRAVSQWSDLCQAAIVAAEDMRPFMRSHSFEGGRIRPLAGAQLGPTPAESQAGDMGDPRMRGPPGHDSDLWNNVSRQGSSQGSYSPPGASGAGSWGDSRPPARPEREAHRFPVEVPGLSFEAARMSCASVPLRELVPLRATWYPTSQLTLGQVDTTVRSVCGGVVYATTGLPGLLEWKEIPGVRGVNPRVACFSLPRHSMVAERAEAGRRFGTPFTLPIGETLRLQRALASGEFPPYHDGNVYIDIPDMVEVAGWGAAAPQGVSTAIGQGQAVRPPPGGPIPDPPAVVGSFPARGRADGTGSRGPSEVRPQPGARSPDAKKARGGWQTVPVRDPSVGSRNQGDGPRGKPGGKGPDQAKSGKGAGPGQGAGPPPQTHAKGSGGAKSAGKPVVTEEPPAWARQILADNQRISAELLALQAGSGSLKREPGGSGA